jgi:acyl carrier protein
VAVVACDDASGTRRLVAYVVAADGAAAAPGQLRAFAMAELPDHMVPTAFVLIDALPLTPHGKLDRRALPAADPALSLAASYVAPSSRTEARLATVWADVLGVARVGVDDDFFELGGHSLLAAEVVAKVSAELGRDVPLRLLFAGPTVGQLARLIEAAPATGRLDERIPRAPRRGLADRRGA